MTTVRARTPVGAGRPGFATGPVAVVVVGLAAVLSALSPRYGFHRDELYFLVAGGHPAWGYVDQPPLTPLVARAATALFGDTPAGLRVVATLASAAGVLVTALIARELNGGRRAQVFAALAAAVSGFVLAVGHMVSTTTFDLLAWLLVAWLALGLMRTGGGRRWLGLGVVVGLALLNKYLVGMLAAALLLAVLAVGPRGALRGRWPVIGVLVAAVIAAPNLWWQATHGWPQLTVAGGISADDGAENRVLFVPMQIVYLSPFLVPVWIAGIRRLWRDPELRWARAMVVAYPVLCVLVLASGGKPYYALPVLLVLTAAGCEPLARWTRGRPRTAVVAVAGVLAAATSALVTLPLLPTSALSAVNGINKEQGEQVGWQALTSAVATQWSAIPPAERAHAVIFAENYGEHGAIARYGPRHGLPVPYSGHMSDFDWGPPPDSATGPVVLVYQDGDRNIGRYFTGCRAGSRVDTGTDNEERGAHVDLCSGTTAPWSVIWPRLRHYY
ncbi:ArnT family glycosyltransferase [Actinoallomurus sp. CA-142502]|uniref:ArnT family glycosyltransferase n=1 Tax=Actinoallomurus sp. CA-142502 TaxID=3239885 RepID=UPI003D94B647